MRVGFHSRVLAAAAAVWLALPAGGSDLYDPGPDLSTAVGRGYAKIFAQTPNYRAVGDAVLTDDVDGDEDEGSEKFRWQFGPMFYRGRLGENQVKVLVIGQEGAQDENISYRSFTGGTGGNMQNFLHALGINRSYLFINTFAYTIYGQYTDFGAPMLRKGNGVKMGLLTWPMFKLAQNEISPIVSHRHALIDHVIASNRRSLKLVVAVGGGAQDTLSTYIMSKGGTCEARNPNPDDFQLIEYKGKNVVQNRYYYYPVDERGNNLLLNPGERHDYKDEAANAKLDERLNDPERKRRYIKRTDGRWKNGLHDMKQLGIVLYSCKVPGSRKTNTLQGLDGIDQDIRFIEVRHPGSRSPSLVTNFKAALKLVREWNGERGWSLPKDTGADQRFDVGFDYRNVHTPRYDYRFGMPDVMTHGSTTSHRMNGGDAIRMLWAGGKWGDNADFPAVRDTYTPRGHLEGIDVPNEPKKTANIDRQEAYFDAGPGDKWARIFLGEDREVPAIYPAILKQPGVKNDPSFGAGAIYRGRPDSAEALILADQFSHDDLWVGRALMGQKGQQLQAYLKENGYGLNYVILRTLPVDTLGAKEADVEKLVQFTAKWRAAVWKKLLENRDNTKRIKAIFTLGEWADEAIKDLETNGIRVTSLTRELGDDAPAIPIARQDIPFGFPMWVGTSGDRASRSTGAKEGKLYKFTAPRWATSFRARPLSDAERRAVEKLKDL